MKDDPTEKLIKDIVTNPLFVGGVLLTGAAMIARTFATPSGRKWYGDEYDRGLREMAEREREREVWSARTKLWREYFGENAPGGQALRRDFVISIGPLEPIPDAEWSSRPAGFRHNAYRITSASLDSWVDVGWDVADRYGWVSLFKQGKQVWYLGTCAGQNTMAFFDTKEPTAEPDIEMATFAARLLAHPKSTFNNLVLVRPGRAAARRRLWIEYMEANPDLASKFEWDPAHPQS